jgi:hypothetical protein
MIRAQKETSLQMAVQLSKEVYLNISGTSLFEQCVHIRGLFDGYALVRRLGDGRVGVAFRGTDSMTDCLGNMLRKRKRFRCIKGAYVHGGFLRQYTDLRTKILQTLCKSFSDWRKAGILTTGHSLGGALATLFAADMACTQPSTKITCYALSSPRVGNRAFSEGVELLPNLQMLRISMMNDIITWFPYLGFVHTRKVIRLSVPPTIKMRWFNCVRRHSLWVLSTALL